MSSTCKSLGNERWESLDSIGSVLGSSTELPTIQVSFKVVRCLGREAAPRGCTWHLALNSMLHQHPALMYIRRLPSRHRHWTSSTKSLLANVCSYYQKLPSGYTAPNPCTASDGLHQMDCCASHPTPPRHDNSQLQSAQSVCLLEAAAWIWRPSGSSSGGEDTAHAEVAARIRCRHGPGGWCGSAPFR